MMRRRFTPRPRGSFRFRGRPRPLGNVKTRITRVQRCQFMLRATDVTPVLDGVTILGATNTAFELAKILDHLADFSTDSGVAMAGFAQSIDITRIHFDYGFMRTTTAEDAGTSVWTNCKWLNHIALCVDRIDAAGIPAAVASTQWFRNQTPTASIGAALPAQETAEMHWPTRVLWERSEAMFDAAKQIVDTTEGTLYVPQDQQVRLPRSGYVSKRIKCRITDEQGLYLVFSVAPWTATNIGFHFDFWAHGSFYYKVNL